MFDDPMCPTFIDGGHMRFVESNSYLHRTAASTTVEAATWRNLVLEWFVNKDWFHSHQKRQRVSGDVVWLYRTTRSISHVRILLSFENRFSEAGVRLIHLNHSGVIRIFHPVGCERQRIINGYASAIEDRQNIGAMRCFWDNDRE